MVRKVRAKKIGQKTTEGKKSKKKIVTGRQSIKDKNQRRGLSNLTPVLATRPTERGFSSLQKRSFR